jgi:hypothetical protein
MSDMQFNCCRPDARAVEMIRKDYERAGYEAPAVIFWNINCGKQRSSKLR